MELLEGSNNSTAQSSILLLVRFRTSPAFVYMSWVFLFSNQQTLKVAPPPPPPTLPPLFVNNPVPCTPVQRPWLCQLALRGSLVLLKATVPRSPSTHPSS